MIDFAHISGLVNFHSNPILKCVHAWEAPEPWCISLGFLWSCTADRQKSRLHPGPPCSPYVTPSVNTAADKLCPSLPDLDIVSSRKDVWNSLTLNQGIIICSEQTASLVLTLTFPDKSPSLFAAVTHTGGWCDWCSRCVKTRHHVSVPCAPPPNGLFPSLRSVQTPKEPTLTSLEDRAMNSRLWLVDTKHSRPVIGQKWVRPGNSWDGAAFKWKGGEGGSGVKSWPVPWCHQWTHQQCHQMVPDFHITSQPALALGNIQET